MFLKGRWIALMLVLTSLSFAMIWIYQVDPSICNGCARCISHCTTGALSMHGSDAVVELSGLASGSYRIRTGNREFQVLTLVR